VLFSILITLAFNQLRGALKKRFGHWVELIF
jgi:hypothetical protein